MRIRPKLTWSPSAGTSLANAASTAVTSSAESPPPASIDDSALDQNASSGKLSGKDTGCPGFWTSPMMQYGSVGSVQSSSLTLLVSLYQIGKPLASSIGPTCFSPTVLLMCAGGGVTAEATRAPEAANTSVATPTVKVLPLRRRLDVFILCSLLVDGIAGGSGAAVVTYPSAGGQIAKGRWGKSRGGVAPRSPGTRSTPARQSAAATTISARAGSGRLTPSRRRRPWRAPPRRQRRSRARRWCASS